MEDLSGRSIILESRLAGRSNIRIVPFKASMDPNFKLRPPNCLLVDVTKEWKTIKFKKLHEDPLNSAISSKISPLLNKAIRE